MPNRKLSDQLYEMKMEFYHNLQTLIEDQQFADRVIELLDDFLTDAENLHFLLGMKIAESLSTDYLDEERRLVSRDE